MTKEALTLALEALEIIANETYDSWTNGAEAGRIARTALLKIKNKCHAIQASDQMACECGNVWDMNDPSPPKCAAIREALAQPEQEPTYTSSQATNCAGCGEHKHTPLRIDAMGGYVCLTCIDKKLGSCFGEFGYEQPEQEPVAWESLLGAVARGWCYEENANKTMDSDLAVAIAKEVNALYTIPPQRTWVGLTDEERNSLYEAHHDKYNLPNQGSPDGMDYERAIEAKLKEKNSA